ncbi:MAG: hypothetical protein RJA99_2430 [Pseudomonadota bacterium]
MTPLRKLGLALAAVFMTATLVATDAEAKRVGGGKNVGKQAPSSTMQRDAAPSGPSGAPSGASGAAPAGPSAAPATPAAPAAAAAPRPATPAAAPAAAAGGKRWLAPLAGLAAGLGLAALASHLGFGEELASFMLMALLALVAIVVVRMILSRRSAAQAQPAFAGAYRTTTGLGHEASVPAWQPAPAAPAPASAPASASAAQPIDAVRAVAEPVTGSVPAGFDAEGFVRNAKVYFVRLQAAFDAGDTQDLREFTSPEMFAELKLEIDERQGRPNRTDVVTLDGRLLGVDAGPTEHLASVRFSGMLREEAGAAAEPFDEVWNFSRPADGSGGWVLAGIQQLSQA